MQKPSFKTCFSTLGCPDLDLDAVLALAAKYDISCLELRSLSDRIDLPAYLSELHGGIPAVREQLASLEHGVRVLGTSCKLVGAKEGSRDDLVAFAKLAEQLGVPYLRVFGGGKWGTPLTDENYAEAIDFLNWWNDLRQAEGWQTDIVIETHDAFSASPPLVELFKRLGRSVSLIWDSHHTWKLGGETPAYSWSQLGPYTQHVHVKDSISEPSARHPYTYVIPGTGEMPLSEVLKILDDANFTESVCLEWEKMWHPYLVDLSEAIAAIHESGWR